MNSPDTDHNDNVKQPDSPEKADAAPSFSSNADLRVPDEDEDVADDDDADEDGDASAEDAAMSPTGLDIDNDHADERPIDRSQDAPEAHNREQDDEAAQAQTVADDAIRGDAAAQIDAEESEHGGRTNPAQINADDAQDVVDHMEQMESSGRIDMDAYRGERNDDDESGMLGEGGMELGDLDEHGNSPRNADEQYTPVE